MHDDWSGEAHTVEVGRRGGELRAVLQLRLAWTDAQGAHVLDSSGERLTVGTDPSNHLVLSDPTVSRFHCELRLEPDRVRLVDLGSRNGTYLGGVRVADAWVHDGATLRVGETSVEVRASGAMSFVELSPREAFGDLVGTSGPMRTLFAALEKAAESDATVLIEGETGTGKEGVAHALHLESPRAAAPFVVVDCGSIPETLIESELFGHERGAFTGATTRHVGAFEAARGGTLLLDEIGELPLALQPRLLRALESRAVKRVGGHEWIPLDVRLVAATHRSLRREVSDGRFRADLYYRLAVLTVQVPPLRERLEDLPRLVQVLAARLGASDEQCAFLASAPVLERLALRDWPGNVRELRNEIERTLVLGGATSPAAEEPVSRLPFGAARRVAIARFERAYLTEVLAECGGVVAEAARRSGIDRVHFHRLLRKNDVR
ncbi:MAG: sigma 54-interacting transcriptional regulator [Sandaracinaceae bacterium]|nr:sigma 54-interacting transcriptional regulator [Sandaracinaceae bacterium]